MARLQPRESFDALKERVTETVSGMFPLAGNRNTIKLNEVLVDDNKDFDDLRGQKDAKLKGGNWTVPVRADVSLMGPDGKEVDRRTIRLMNLPKITPRHSYILGGREYQMDNQWQLRPGVYSRVSESGELESKFNLKGRSFQVEFDPESAKFVMRRKSGSAAIPLLPLMQEMGVSEESLKDQWGPEVLKANSKGDRDKAVMSFYQTMEGKAAESPTDARQFLKSFMEEAKLDPKVSRITLGGEHTNVTGEVLAKSAGRLLGISRGEDEPDKRDALMFKRFRGTEDYVSEALVARSKDILQKVRNNIDRKKRVDHVIYPDLFTKPVTTVFTKTSLKNNPDQVNPLEMISGGMRTTLMGEGGISDANRITGEAKLVDDSHMGFLDPMHTPESDKAGVTLQLSYGAQKKGDGVVIPMFNVKTGKTEMVGPEVVYNSNVVMSDQIQWKKGKPTPIGGKTKVKIAGPHNRVAEGLMKDADYVMPSPTQLFSPASNLIPFLQNTSGNRSTMAGRHMEQAIPLRDREAPLVQTMVSANHPSKRTFNDVLGAQSSHKASVGGEVVKIGPDGITIKDEKGKKHEVQIYDNFPLNDEKSFLHSDPSVKLGDKVKAGQVVADTNFTRGGQLAMGTNLRAAYTPLKGYNFEDGVVISESAAQKLSSVHMHKKGMDVTDEHVMNRKQFVANKPTVLTKEQLGKIDSAGVIRPGTEVKPGDILVAALRKTDPGNDEAKQMRKMHRSLVEPYDDVSIRWESDHPGVVTNVVKRGKRTEVHVKTAEPAEIGDKIAGRHGNKGIITAIFPDKEMPKTGDKKPIDIALNPAGVPGRLNLGQIMETAAGKIAEKTGQTYKIQNFDGTEDWRQRVSDDLKAHGLTDKETLYDPKTGKAMGSALVGPHYVHKLKHQISRKLTSRSGGVGYLYDMDKQPKAGGKHSAQSMDALGMYAMLAHGAKHNIRDMQTYKSDMSDEVWAAVQSGNPLPPPKPTFAYNKFMGYMKALGVNVEKKGNDVTLLPMTDKQVIAMSNGELKDAGRMFVSKTEEPEKKGLFDKKITGGFDGTKWSHITLPERMPNPIFEKGIVGVTGIRDKDFSAIMSGKTGVDPKTGALVPPEEGLTHGKAIESLLTRIDVDKEIAAAKEQLQKPGLTGNRLDRVNRRVRYLNVLKDNEISPRDAYMTQHVPVMPPSMRPLSILPDGSVSEDDLNGMYKSLALASRKLNDADATAITQERINRRRETVYDGLKSLAGLGGYQNRQFRGVLDIISGHKVDPNVPGKTGKPAEGYFQKRLIKRRQDLSMRGVIVPDPELGLDEVGIPRKAAMEAYKPFVVSELSSLSGVSALAAKKMVENDDPQAMRALARVIEKRPLLLKRDPVLHKYGVQAFKPKLIGGKAIKIHPLVTSGYNADFDGDQMNAYVPLSQDAVAEAYKMLPSNNLFSPSTGGVMYTPTHEAQLGLHMLTREGNRTTQKFKSEGDAAKAVESGKLGMTDMATIAGTRTTMGRVLVSRTVPAALRKPILDGSQPMNKKGTTALFTSLGREHKDSFAVAADRLKDLGNKYATETSFSLGLDDIKPDKALRERALKIADAEVAKIEAGKGSAEAKEAGTIAAYDRASQRMIKGIEATHGKNPTNLWHMKESGMKPNMTLYRQIVAAPMLATDTSGRTLPHPIRKSYSEGLDVGDYWTAQSGARKGVIMKVQAVRDPGYLTKQVMNVSLGTPIVSEDCGTRKGIALSLDEPDVLDRHLAETTKAGKHTFRAGTLMTPGVVDRLRNNKVKRVVVRSPLRCDHGEGLCAKCYGMNEDGRLPENGFNAGVASTQAIGERATQLSMRVFHEGGVAPVGQAGKAQAALTDDFKRVQQLLYMPQKLPGSAPLSHVTGSVQSIVKNPAGGHDVTIGGKKHYIPQDRGVPSSYGRKGLVPLKKGSKVRRGDRLSQGPANPNEMLPLTGLDQVQGYMSGELHDLYKSEGIRRRNVEVVVRNVTNNGQISDPGDNAQLLRGDLVPLSRTRADNRDLIKRGLKPARVEPVLKGINQVPNYTQTDWLARMNRERLKENVMEGATRGWTSKLHGTNPIPGMAYGAEFGKSDKKPY